MAATSNMNAGLATKLIGDRLSFFNGVIRIPSDQEVERIMYIQNSARNYLLLNQDLFFEIYNQLPTVEFEALVQYLNNNRDKDFKEIIFNLPLFLKQKENFEITIDNLTSVPTVRVRTDIVCIVATCRSRKIVTIGRFLRAGDEAQAGVNTCLECGHEFR